jgi:hypothetical protein
MRTLLGGVLAVLLLSIPPTVQTGDGPPDHRRQPPPCTELSPFAHVRQITEPVLLINGEADDDPAARGARLSGGRVRRWGTRCGR